MWPVTGFDERFLRGGPPALDDRGSYPSDRAAWEAVLRDPNLAIVDAMFLQEGEGGPPAGLEIGSAFSAKDPYTGRTRTLTIAALAPSDYFIANGVFYGIDGARTLFGYRLAFDRLYVGLEPGVDADAFAQAVQAKFIANGVEAYSIETIMDEGFTMTRQIFQLFEGYLAMGLIVGIAGTAVVMVRAVRERRRQIGTLRALGFGARPVGRSFAIETGFVAAEGTVIGAVARARDALRHRRDERLVRGDDVLDPVSPARRAAPRHRRRVAARHDLADDRREPDQACRRSPDDGLTSAAAKESLCCSNTSSPCRVANGSTSGVGARQPGLCVAATQSSAGNHRRERLRRGIRILPQRGSAQRADGVGLAAERRWAQGTADERSR